MTVEAPIKTILALIVILSSAFGTFFVLDDRHAQKEELTRAEAEMTSELVQRVMMSESTRYAEIAVYYTDKMRDGEILTPAEESRLELVQGQQQRINETLMGSK